MRPATASGTCGLVTVAARGQMSFPCALVAADKVLPSYTRGGVRTFEFMTVGF